jgi:hypothetical protein
MDTTITVTPNVTTLINILTVEPENQTKLVELVRIRRITGVDSNRGIST